MKPIGGLRKEENLGQSSRELFTCEDQAEERRQRELEERWSEGKELILSWSDVSENMREKGTKKTDVRMEIRMDRR